MQISLRNGLPYVRVVLEYEGNMMELQDVVLDTGSATSIFPVEQVAEIGMYIEPDDPILEIHGVGGVEYVVEKWMGSVQLGELQANNLRIEVGAMQDGLDIDAILGMDFLLETRAVIDLGRLTLSRTI